ncbi:head decoration [Rhodococcus phage Trina]|uniref:Tail fiber protein n=1 Tax=Rhodococcus phage Trina TaxID=2027905 RepID=A0A2D1ADT9_9CAUD|nr:head decoration [Rhodococcus phage Trina]ASZ74984.1 hypothetical protein SEA_TRINA_205 [Rhodococcus phage Trina]
MPLIKYATHVDAGGYEIRNRKVEVVTSLPTPTAAQEGREVYNSTDKRFYVCNGSGWTLKATDSDALNGQAAAFYLNRSNHTGTQTASTITDFDTQARSSRLDQFAIPTASVNLNSQKLINIGNGTAPNDAVSKSQLDAVAAIANAGAAGVSIKLAARAVAKSNITLSATQTVDGIALSVGDRVLVTGQTTASTNGIYLVAAGAWTRTTDADQDGELAPGTLIAVREGSTEGDTLWGITSDAAIVIGTTNQTWARVIAGSSSGFTVAGNGLTSPSAGTVAVQPGAGIIADGSSTRVDFTVVARKYVGTVGTSGTTVTVTHNLNTTDVSVSVKEASSGDIVLTGVSVTGVNTVDLTFGVVPTSNQYRVIVIG